ncbi:MAG TPA: M23 family metallopeptidase [Croceibacterium sp.]|nr:M23 family metallopeptidase [Croceibacterium sp.]
MATPPVAVAPSSPSIDDTDAGRPEALELRGVPRQGGIILGRLARGARALTLNGEDVAYDGEGRFIIAFDRDASEKAELELRFADGYTARRTLSVAPGAWRIEQVNANPTGGAATSEEFQARRAGELAQIAAARATTSQSDGWRQSFIWPVSGRISGVFGSQRVYRGQPGSYHSGLDIAGGAGAVYVAPADGVVTLAVTTPFTLEGNLLMIDHGMGLNSAFLHSQRLLVKAGDVVRQGQPLGIIGATGRVSGPHLHWSMKWNAARIDPLPLLPPP